MYGSKHRNRPGGRSNLAARMGRWSAAHWKTATFGWLAFVLVAFGLGGAVGMKSIDDNAPGPGESGRMDRILDAGFQQPVVVACGEALDRRAAMLFGDVPIDRRVDGRGGVGHESGPGGRGWGGASGSDSTTEPVPSRISDTAVVSRWLGAESNPSKRRVNILNARFSRRPVANQGLQLTAGKPHTQPTDKRPARRVSAHTPRPGRS